MSMVLSMVMRVRAEYMEREELRVEETSEKRESVREMESSRVPRSGVRGRI